MFRASTFLVLLFLALIFSNCSTNCEECPNDFSVRFQIVDSLSNEVVTDPSMVSITYLDSLNIGVERDETEQDTLFLSSFALTPEPDTVVFMINNTVLDTAAVEYGFQRDSDCCINPRIVERLNFFNLNTVRVVRSSYTYTRIFVN